MYYYEVSILGTPLDLLTYQYIQNITVGTLVQVPLRGRQKLQTAVIINIVEKPTFKCIDIDTISCNYLSNDMMILALFVSKYYVSPLGITLNIFRPFYNIDKVATNNIIKSDIVLSSEQQKGYEFIQQNDTSLLFANTSSGKTEIYIKTIEDTLNANNQALLLLPEISLTPQIEKRLKIVFGDSLAIWHSKIQKKKRDEIVQKLISKEVKVIVGARSALFLPFEKLKLIIVDEENDAITATNRLLWVYPGIHEALNVIINQWVEKNMDTKTNFNNLIKNLEKVEEDND
jgi:primosomal protein N' (replication factor Y)